ILAFNERGGRQAAPCHGQGSVFRWSHSPPMGIKAAPFTTEHSPSSTKNTPASCLHESWATSLFRGRVEWLTCKASRRWGRDTRHSAFPLTYTSPPPPLSLVIYL
ncbi:unnamed protein product, partial [Ectocarpus sp. 4 AP-2014]